MPRKELERWIAAILDHPSLYMGGPSQGNLQRARKIIAFLEKEGLLVEQVKEP